MNQISLDNSNISNFLNHLNKKGFILEDKTYKLLKAHFPSYEIIRNLAIEGTTPQTGTNNIQHAEIDLFVRTPNNDLVIECKRTSFTWFFPKNKDRKNIIYFVYDTNKGLTKKGLISDDAITTYSDLALEISADGKVTPNTNYKDVRDNTNQVLRTMQIYLSKITPLKRFISKALIPVIVTNTPLYLVTYKTEQLTSNGDLNAPVDITQIPFLAYNVSRLMRWDVDCSQTIKHIGYKEASDPDDFQTVFICNVETLNKFIAFIEDSSLVAMRVL